MAVHIIIKLWACWTLGREWCMA